MDTSILENQEELMIEQFNGSFRKALDKKSDENRVEINEPLKSEEKNISEQKKTTTEKKKKVLSDKSVVHEQETVRISISKSLDKKLRKIILQQYVDSGEKVSIKQFVENSISYYIEKNKL